MSKHGTFLCKLNYKFYLIQNTALFALNNYCSIIDHGKQMLYWVLWIDNVKCLQSMPCCSNLLYNPLKDFASAFVLFHDLHNSFVEP